ncbi:tumor necrosis factor receptor superfamily member 6 isoform X2 [Neopelma chrysocephalum]|uniref:tumor necrosis factor receptor superfamily member 6 isoform X2 n=1 Tax=Neopelma chrysocephalum TaxID=114329 RepID=UPI000FCD3DBF|nr:tumor necrosis factor receptor superfamily member 6 isoform X2 [Neopelma chrysocephalum]
MARGLLPLLLVPILIIEAQCKNYTEALMHIDYNRRIIARREINCNQDEYDLDGQCCKKCKSGFVKNITCPTDISKHCARCESGKEYTDHLNDLNECRRCSLCDGVFGLEVVKNCTPEENTECACVKNHFCNSVACTECTPCTVCESGVIEKQCTSTSNTVCGIKGKRKQKGLTTKENLSEVVFKAEPSYENVPLIDTDADLSSHIAGVVEEMTFPQVLTFVRHHRVPEPAIDQVIRDCPGDTSEQKIKLFRTWYQRHGIKGAYGTLVSSLRQLKMCAAADKIEEKLKAAVSSCQEGRQSYNGDTEQSKTCTQEGRNSYNDSAEQCKTYAGSLEETAQSNLKLISN